MKHTYILYGELCHHNEVLTEVGVSPPLVSQVLGGTDLLCLGEGAGGTVGISQMGELPAMGRQRPRISERKKEWGCMSFVFPDNVDQREGPLESSM